MHATSILFTAALLLGTTFSHPGAHESHDLHRRAHFASHAKRSLADCAGALKTRGIESRAIARREALAASLRKARSIEKSGNYLRARDLDSVLAADHHSNLTGITVNSDPAVLFSGDVKCILQPEVTQGPYYVDGELIRNDIREDQAGVDLYADVQLIDINTCEPVPDVYMDWWHANSTGVYSGVVANGNGDSSDSTNLNNTFLRGIQKTDSDGVAQFTTLFPGHYTSRATHVHILSHVGSTVQANGTISGGSASHVGQLFFDQSLIADVETNEPYASNTQQLTLNSADQILSQEAADMDPVMEYVLLGDDSSEGVLAWISIGIDSTSSYSVNSAATWTANGGVENANSGAPGGGNGSAPPGGSPPSGAPPARN
ncbi:Intradiol ring-cleavage dioxygenase [Geopyxis carbonaria]|nr:Intradiol ring-cleavage dioxygenase [Geopyxis carbonaria]